MATAASSSISMTCRAISVVQNLRHIRRVLPYSLEENDQNLDKSPEQLDLNTRKFIIHPIDVQFWCSYKFIFDLHAKFLHPCHSLS